jgi:hypothetical protein
MPPPRARIVFHITVGEHPGPTHIMKRALLILALTLLLLPTASGCIAFRNKTGENKCGRAGCGGLLKNLLCCRAPKEAGGPANTPTYGYPYYTIRGPRDFLVDNPPPLGP